ncbi:MAG TPA: M48 family metalloprotease [Candidatus Acidoferrum sp.]|nr:M48 family metalloprotease [Candidatus Acidoferrum sp.]
MRIIRTTFLLGVLTLVLMMVGQYFGGRNGMTIGLGIAIVTNAFAYFFSDKIALASSGALSVSREQLPRLYDVMERLAAKNNIPVPTLYVIAETAPNAFATGRNPRHASVAVTQGLLELMNDEELEGVIAHELSHVRNYDILISSIAATLAGAITWIAHWGPWLGMGDGDDERDRGGGWIFALLLMILAPLASSAPAVGPFTAAGIFRRRNGRPHGWKSIRLDQRASEAGCL